MTQRQRAAALTRWARVPVPGRLGARLREARISRGWSQEDLAVRAGGRWPLSKSFVSLIEHGRALPSLRIFAALVRTLEISADDLLDRDSLDWHPEVR